MFVSTNRIWILMFHDRATVDVERGDKDIFDMELRGICGVL